MNYPAASSGVSTKDWVVFTVASDGVLDPMLRNKIWPLVRSKHLYQDGLVILKLACLEKAPVI